jgi:two-component system, chemotaxis family, CheB/CheR fusion protein
VQERHLNSLNREPERVIVGLGASAGGLAALKTFFAHVPENTGLTFVVVMHLSTEHESHLAELLQPFIDIPVTQVAETLAMEPDHVYVIPPGCNLSAIDSHLRLSDLETQRRQRAPIDHFFRTLAKTHDGNAIAVILSGTGSDGALGLKAVRESGGLALVQDPTESEYDGMPRSAIATGLVDRAMPVAEMPATIINYARTRPNLTIPDNNPTKSDIERHLAQVVARLRARTGRDFSRYKTSTVVRRIQRRMQINQVETLSAYEDLLTTTPAEAISLADDMLITVTNFFRDTQVFEFLEREVVPRLFEGKTQDDEVRAWTAGCATGEEAYSVAILLLEHATRMKSAPRIQFFASDLHEESLAKAREGFYSEEVAIDVGLERLARFFVKHEGGYQVRQELRDTIVFTTHNLLADPPFSKLDFISCRNLLIYLRRDVQPRVLELFHYALRADGVLLLGTSETGDESNLFRILSKTHCVYEKRNVPQSELQLPVFPLAPSHQRAPGAQSEEGQAPDLHTYGQMHLTLLEQYAPPSLVVNAAGKVVHLSPHVGRFLVHAGGEPTTGVLKLIRPEFQAALGEALRAAREGCATESERIPARLNGQTKIVSLTVRPATGDREQDGFLLVVFNEEAGPADEQLIEKEPDHTDPRAVDLARTQQRLQSLIEDHEASKEEMQAANEELQSSNEELRSTMEELETSKEELQSMNEELRTVNQENRNKVEELASLSADLQSLMAATQIPTLFLDRDLRIIRYTPQLSEIFHIRMSDRGRPVTELKPRIVYEELQDDARRVLERLAPIEREIRQHGTEARWFLTRVLPYHGIENRLDGVVITFVDITLRKDAESFVHQTAQRFRGLVEASAQMVWTTDVQGGVIEDSPSWREFTGQSYDQSKGFGWLHAVHPDDRTTARSAWAEATRTSGTLVSEFRVYHAATESYRWTAVRAVPLRKADGQIDGWVGMNIDISELRAADDALRDADKRKDEFLAILGHELRNPLAPLATGIQLLRNAGDKPEIVETVQTMMGRQLHHLVRLVDDLLDLSRITRGRVDLKREPLDLRTVIERAIEVSRTILTDNRHKLTLKLPKEPMPVDGDFDRLTQVIGNLVNNAGKYTAPGGKIEVSARTDDGRAIVRVRDNGFGIPPERINKLFRMFSQVPEHRARAGGGGLGIGLALSRHLVELHGGVIGVTSEGLGKGSEFTVRLPLTKRALPVGSEEPDWDSTQMPLRRVLVVDDNVDAATSLSMMLLAKGHTVQTVHDASAALKTIDRFAPEIVLLDIELPGMSGYEVAQRIRSMDGGREIVLVAITGRGQKEDKERAMEAGFDEHLTKPVDTSLLASVIINGSGDRPSSL